MLRAGGTGKRGETPAYPDSAGPEQQPNRDGSSRLSAPSAQRPLERSSCGFRISQLAGDVSVRRRTRSGCRLARLPLGVFAPARRGADAQGTASIPAMRAGVRCGSPAPLKQSKAPGIHRKHARLACRRTAPYARSASGKPISPKKLFHARPWDGIEKPRASWRHRARRLLEAIGLVGFGRCKAPRCRTSDAFPSGQ